MTNNYFTHEGNHKLQTERTQPKRRQNICNAIFRILNLNFFLVQFLEQFFASHSFVVRSVCFYRRGSFGLHRSDAFEHTKHNCLLTRFQSYFLLFFAYLPAHFPTDDMQTLSNVHTFTSFVWLGFQMKLVHYFSLPFCCLVHVYFFFCDSHFR